MKKIPVVAFEFINKWASVKAFNSDLLFSSNNINCLISFTDQTKLNLFYLWSSFLSLHRTSKTSRATISSPLIHLKRTQGSSDSRNIYSNPQAVQWPVCLAALLRPSPRCRRQTVRARLWKQPIKDFHVSGKSIKIACSSHGFSRLKWSQRDLQRFTGTLTHGNLCSTSMLLSCMDVCIFIVS